METLIKETQEARIERIVDGLIEIRDALEWPAKPVRNLINLSVLTDEQIASAMNVTLDYIAEIRETMSS